MGESLAFRNQAAHAVVRLLGLDKTENEEWELAIKGDYFLTGDKQKGQKTGRATRFLRNTLRMLCH